MRNQVTPFSINSPSGEKLYAWHILPIELYRYNEAALHSECSGFTPDFTQKHAFKLLHDDPDALLVIHMHGAAGTGKPDKIHVLTFDYGGFGRSRGQPTERSVCLEAVAVVEWALKIANVPPSRIVIFGQSLGPAVNLAIAEHFALQSPPTVFAGHILVAPFVDVATLMATYKVAGTVPLLGPVTSVPPFF